MWKNLATCGFHDTRPVDLLGNLAGCTNLTFIMMHTSLHAQYQFSYREASSVVGF
jgi:hypothetical protein